MNKPIDLRNWARFACEMQWIREDFPEHAKEIDRAIYDVGQKLEHCDDPNCTCQMSFRNFHAVANQNAQQEL